MKRIIEWVKPAVIGLAFLSGPRANAVDLEPDMIVLEPEPYQIQYEIGDAPGQVTLRVSSSTANIGAGPLHLIGVSPPLTDSTRQVNQRIFRDDMSFWDRTAGVFLDHSEHGHIHFENWLQFRIRQWLPGDGVGPILAEGAKISFCLADLFVYDSTLTGFPPTPTYITCDTLVQGISVGWRDEYSYCTPGQEIDVSALVDGNMYWLESEVDPDSLVLESNEANNISRVKFTLSVPMLTGPDSYEPNDSIPLVEAVPMGQPNSPNIGPCGPELLITGLTMHRITQQNDYFRIFIQSGGSANDFVAVTREYADQVWLRIYLIDEMGQELRNVGGMESLLRFDLAGIPSGWYFVRVVNACNLTPSYNLWIDPPQNAPPWIGVISPGVDGYTVVQGATFDVVWSVAEPDGDSWWATVYCNEIPEFNGSEFILPGARLIPDSPTQLSVATQYYPPNPCYFYVEITDGGSVVGDWSDGALTVLSCECGCGNDPECDGSTDVVDVVGVINVAFRASPGVMDGDCYVERSDVNCDKATDVIDVVRMVNVAFRNGDPSSQFCSPCSF